MKTFGVLCLIVIAVSGCISAARVFYSSTGTRGGVKPMKAIAKADMAL